LYAVKAMPRPRSLTPSAIAAAALAVIDRDGLAALSMRAVATELGTGTMSLYRYVEDREQLERLVVDLVLSAVDPEVPSRGPWQRQVTVLAERVRAAVGAHPSVVPLLLTHRQSAVGVMRWAEAVLTVLTGAGFTGRRRIIAFRGLLSYLIGALEAEHLGPLSGAGTAILAELPRDEYPMLADTARHARRVGPDEEFRGGLAIVLRGLGTR
jgi:AcrR family transcriptional regulator